MLGFTIPFGNKHIVSAEKVRYLGVIVDERSTFGPWPESRNRYTRGSGLLRL